jgi:hypothetical protein
VKPNEIIERIFVLRGKQKKKKWSGMSINQDIE